MSAIGFASCGDSSSSGTSSSTSSAADATVTTVKKVDVSDTDQIESIAEDTRKELVWMSFYDLNPDESKGEDKSVEMTLFNNKGGTIKYSAVTYDERFDKLAAALISGVDIPDLFKYEWLSFPSQTLMGMYQPIDDIVDFSDPLWAETKATADQFVLNGKHYVAPISVSVGTMMMYDHALIEANGLDDPYEAYVNGKWDWNLWTKLMSDFVADASEGEERYGINGWFQPQIIQQTGKTMINYDGSKFTSNLEDADIARAEGVLYEVSKGGFYNPNWLNNAKGALSDGNNLFYCMGTWAMTGDNGPDKGDDWRIVPVPKDPNASEDVMTGDMLAYMWVKGSDAKDAVKTWYECCRIAQTDPQYKDNAKEKFFNANPNWTEEMYQTLEDASSMKNKMIFDYGYGLSNEMSDTTTALYEHILSTDDQGVQWTWATLRETYSSIVDAEISTVNEEMGKFNG